jgi:hypothetical protein
MSMVRPLLVSLSLTALVLTGCATTRSADTDLVEISRLHKAGCQEIGDLQLTCASRNELESAIRAEAASQGANYVQVTSLKVGSLTGRVKVSGLALRCPQKKLVRLKDYPVLSPEELEAAVRPLETKKASKDKIHSSNTTRAAAAPTHAMVVK